MYAFPILYLPHIVHILSFSSHQQPYFITYLPLFAHLPLFVTFLGVNRILSMSAFFVLHNTNSISILFHPWHISRMPTYKHDYVLSKLLAMLWPTKPNCWPMQHLLQRQQWPLLLKHLLVLLVPPLLFILHPKNSPNTINQNISLMFLVAYFTYLYSKISPELVFFKSVTWPDSQKSHVICFSKMSHDLFLKNVTWFASQKSLVICCVCCVCYNRCREIQSDTWKLKILVISSIYPRVNGMTSS